jgi:hypothetical protein
MQRQLSQILSLAESTISGNACVDFLTPFPQEVSIANVWTVATNSIGFVPIRFRVLNRRQS